MEPFRAVATLDAGGFAVLSIDPTIRCGDGCRAIVESVHRTLEEAEAAMRGKAAAGYEFPYWLCGCPLCRERARRETPNPHDQNTRESSDE